MYRQLLEPGKRIGGWPMAITPQNAASGLTIS
jgi:hypothetical protein